MTVRVLLEAVLASLPVVSAEVALLNVSDLQGVEVLLNLGTDLAGLFDAEAGDGAGRGQDGGDGGDGEPHFDNLLGLETE